MKKLSVTFPLAASLLLCLTALPVRAQWSQTSGTGPYIFTDPANWYGGVVTNLFTNAIPSGMTINFTGDHILSGGLILGFPGSSNLTMQSDSATARTLHISLGQFLRTNASGGTINIGTTTNPLVLDLYNSSRTIGGSTPFTTSFGNICTLNIYAQIVDLAGGTNGLTCGGGNTYGNLLNTNNSFVGPVTFPSLRGGGFANIKPIGGGPSALGAPTDTTNGTVTVADGGSSGSLKYLGTGDTTDRPFIWNITAYHTNQSWTGDYQFFNAGSGLLKFTGPWTFPTNRTANSELVINASTAPIEFDGYMNGTGNANGTSTSLLFAGGPAGVATNRIILTGATNDFKDFMISNVVVAFNGTAPAGTPSPLGAGTNIIHGGGSGSWGGWVGGTGQGASLQYYGPNATFSRNVTFNGGSSSYYWALDNAGTNRTLIWSNSLAWNLPAAVIGFNPRYLFINPNYSSTNVVLSWIPDANVVVSGSPIGTIVAAANPAGYTVNNGGVVQLLNPTNTFAGGVQAAYARTVQALTVADIGQPSSIGTAQNPYTVGTPSIQLTGIILGSTDSQRGGAFSYIGTNNASSNQKITILGSSGSLCSGTVRNDSPNSSSLHLTDTGGWNLYSTMPNCLATLGGSARVTNTLDSYMQDVNGLPGSGSLLVNGSAWRLTANHTYSGTTTVANATLVLNGSIATGLGLTVGTGGVLAGTGTVNEVVNVLTNGTITAGDGAIGTLSLNGDLTNVGTVFMKLSKQDRVNDVLELGGNTIVYGGILSVTNLAGNLAISDQFKLFNAGSYQGAFSSITPATPGSGLAWDLTSLGSDGTLKVIAGAAAPPHITGSEMTSAGLVMSGTNGSAGTKFYVLSSTNVALPLIQWSRASTNMFDGSGNFIVTNAINPNIRAEFFRLQLQ
jgi:hypothetical protein